MNSLCRNVVQKNLFENNLHERPRNKHYERVADVVEYDRICGTTIRRLDMIPIQAPTGVTRESAAVTAALVFMESPLRMPDKD